MGAAATAALFTIGKFLIGLYLGKSTIGSTYGAAGGVIIMIVWVYYSAQILFLGAEFTQVYANRYGSRVAPAENAEPVTAEKRAEEGLATTGDRGVIRTSPREDKPLHPAYGIIAIVALTLSFMLGRHSRRGGL